MSKIPDSGFKKALGEFLNSPKREVVDDTPLTDQQRQNIKEGFRLYARHLVQVIDRTSLPIKK